MVSTRPSNSTSTILSEAPSLPAHHRLSLSCPCPRPSSCAGGAGTEGEALHSAQRPSGLGVAQGIVLYLAGFLCLRLKKPLLDSPPVRLLKSLPFPARTPSRIMTRL